MAYLNSITLGGARSSFRLGGVLLRRTQLHRRRNGAAHAGVVAPVKRHSVAGAPGHVEAQLRI